MEMNKIHSNTSVLKKLITHNGSFHTDDVFAAATLSLVLEKMGEDFEIIRTRDEEIIKNGDYVFDVGGIYDEEKNRFDHHQKGGAGKRYEIEYSSFGLVWKKYGIELTESEKIVEIVDRHLVAPIDASDNGIDLVESKHKIFPYLIQDFFRIMRPTWRETNSNINEMFFKSVEIAKEILLREIIYAKDAILADEAILSIYNNTKDKRFIVLDKNYAKKEILEKLTGTLFVVYPRETSNTWGVEAIRKDFKSFENKKNLPTKWGGFRDEELQNITGVKDAVFCHKALFIAVAKTKEGAIKLAELAILR
ncbi:MAG: MYG1 family protein [Candidatus Paceibacterota bacterium]